jgi:aspartate racemase
MSYKIGFLGGIGPEATGTFYLQLIKKLQASGKIKSNTDFPQIIINSIPAPELLSANNNSTVLDPYIKGLRELEACGVEFIVMICNTIHTYHSLLQAEVTKAVKSKKIRSAVILATPITIESGLLKVDGVNYYNLGKDEIYTISDSIYNFNLGFEKAVQASRILAIANKYMDQGAEMAILDCTEISLMLNDSHIKKIDTMDILLEATIGLILQS